jgi:hypothetical protein
MYIFGSHSLTVFSALSKLIRVRMSIVNKEDIGELTYFQNGTVVPYRFETECTEAELYHLRADREKITIERQG